jgi:RNase P/RNase MRP subunit POP5
MPTPTSRVAEGSSLDLLDPANGQDAERFLWTRALADPSLPRLDRIDLLDHAQRTPGEVLHAVSRDGSTAARVSAGELEVHCKADPGEPVLGDIVALAGSGPVSVVVTEGHPLQAALVERHGFVEHERRCRFRTDLASTDLPDGVDATTLAQRDDLARSAFALLHDEDGDASFEAWLADIASSPVLGRDLVVVVHDQTDEVQAAIVLERDAAYGDGALVARLAVSGSGDTGTVLRAATALAAGARLRRLRATVPEHDPMCGTYRDAGWTEDPVSVVLRRPA